MICNLCNVQGHKSANCPNKDKCRRCGESGHFARSCPNPWGNVASTTAAAVDKSDFPSLPGSGPVSDRADDVDVA